MPLPCRTPVTVTPRKGVFSEARQRIATCMTLHHFSTIHQIAERELESFLTDLGFLRHQHRVVQV